MPPTHQQSKPSALAVEAEVEERFAARRRTRFAALVSEHLIEEHRTSPVGDHSPALATLLTALRQAPVAGKLVLLETKVGEEWMIIRLSGRAGVPHDLTATRRYATLDAALHAVFLRRLAELGLLDESEAPW